MADAQEVSVVDVEPAFPDRPSAGSGMGRTVSKVLYWGLVVAVLIFLLSVVVMILKPTEGFEYDNVPALSWAETGDPDVIVSRSEMPLNATPPTLAPKLERYSVADNELFMTAHPEDTYVDELMNSGMYSR